jgi:hypothetical protein
VKRYSNADYDGIECIVDEVEATDGEAGTHHVMTKNGNTPVATGDYVIHGIVRTPRDMAGYHSDTVAKVVRGRNGKPVDSLLTLGEPDSVVPVEDDREYVDDDDDELVGTRKPVKKTAEPVKK